MKDIKLVENVQRRATKFIVNDFSMDYKSHLLQLKLLPLSMLYELNDICLQFACIEGMCVFIDISIEHVCIKHIRLTC